MLGVKKSRVNCTAHMNSMSVLGTGSAGPTPGQRRATGIIYFIGQVFWEYARAHVRNGGRAPKEKKLVSEGEEGCQCN